MRKKLLIVAIVLIALVVSYLVVMAGGKSKEDAIEEAKNYQTPAGVVCVQVLTPAVHQETGATYTFPNGCLPPGWEATNP